MDMAHINSNMLAQYDTVIHPKRPPFSSLVKKKGSLYSKHFHGMSIIPLTLVHGESWQLAALLSIEMVSKMLFSNTGHLRSVG
jgi:hypothetical protein